MIMNLEENKKNLNIFNIILNVIFLIAMIWFASKKLFVWAIIINLFFNFMNFIIYKYGYLYETYRATYSLLKSIENSKLVKGVEGRINDGTIQKV